MTSKNTLPAPFDGSQSPVVEPLTTELNAVLANIEAFESDRGAYSEQTWRALVNVWGQWAAWCVRNRVAQLPVQPESLRNYLEELSTRLASNSISTHAALIAMVEKNAGLIPATASPTVQRVLKKIRRNAVENGETIGQAIPLRRDHIKMLMMVWNDKTSLTQARNLAFLSVAFHTLLRISEMSRLVVGDLDVNPDGTGLLYVARTKTNLSGDGEYKYLSKWCVDLIRHWLMLAELTNEPRQPMFCRVNKYNKAMPSGKPMTTDGLRTIFSAGWGALNKNGELGEAGERYQTWTGHSSRVGAAQDMAASNVAQPLIMEAGGWRDAKTVQRYIRKQAAAEGAMFKMMQDYFD
ncbi:MAG TPA: tyrosine-type recombinase/integrase [Buttiauxella sp.]|jgi:integrase